MTRINLIPVDELSRNHLIAEYRELPSVFGHVRKAQAKGLRPEDIDAPATYVLGPGHMKFFYARLTWLSVRYYELVREMSRRGYTPNYPDLGNKAEGLASHWFGDWEPSPEEIAISQARIDERLANRMTYKNKPGERAAPKGNEWDFM